MTQIYRCKAYMQDQSIMAMSQQHHASNSERGWSIRKVPSKAYSPYFQSFPVSKSQI